MSQLLKDIRCHKSKLKDKAQKYREKVLSGKHNIVTLCKKELKLCLENYYHI